MFPIVLRKARNRAHLLPEVVLLLVVAGEGVGRCDNGGLGAAAHVVEIQHALEHMLSIDLFSNDLDLFLISSHLSSKNGSLSFEVLDPSSTFLISFASKNDFFS